ncbi:hypothetical protein E2C01_047399 [Portunus trituberculatus]|uniref:Uncharacterized protein n=1 Tax=Portunus trituberculatus TaxID=210409 RepID=A0A5B7G7T5_PORTR|nr:hypothetical protein [Portunus trituberculatus]
MTRHTVDPYVPGGDNPGYCTRGALRVTSPARMTNPYAISYVVSLLLVCLPIIVGDPSMTAVNQCHIVMAVNMTDVHTEPVPDDRNSNSPLCHLVGARSMD